MPSNMRYGQSPPSSGRARSPRSIPPSARLARIRRVNARLPPTVRDDSRRWPRAGRGPPILMMRLTAHAPRHRSCSTQQNPPRNSAHPPSLETSPLGSGARLPIGAPSALLSPSARPRTRHPFASGQRGGGPAPRRFDETRRISASPFRALRRGGPRGDRDERRNPPLLPLPGVDLRSS